MAASPASVLAAEGWLDIHHAVARGVLSHLQDQPLEVLPPPDDREGPADRRREIVEARVLPGGGASAALQRPQLAQQRRQQRLGGRVDAAAGAERAQRGWAHAGLKVVVQVALGQRGQPRHRLQLRISPLTRAGRPRPPRRAASLA
jgi:hypothetical protein